MRRFLPAYECCLLYTSYKVDMPEHLKEKQLAKAVKQAVHFLETQGLTVLDFA